MVRVLVMIAVMGFVLSVATLTAAFAIGGPEAIARGGWSIADGRWGWDDDDDWDNGDVGSRTTREVAWDGGESLDIGVPATVSYIQAAGPGKVTISGPARVVSEIVVRNGHIRYEHGRHRRAHGLEITVQAPGVMEFDVSGRTRLSITNFKQPRLSVDISGAADVEASGEADEIDVDISGSGEADLGDLKTKAARVDISGSGDATIAPTESAHLEISGRGDVNMTTSPPRLETDISGAGEVHYLGGGGGDADTGEASPSPSPSPTPSPTPKKKT